MSCDEYLWLLVKQPYLAHKMAARTRGKPAMLVLLTLLPALAHAWHTGRATYYGGPNVLSTTYDAARGQGSFGILAWGSCGYTNSDAGLIFPADMYAAAADANVDYSGSCGRCYEVRCVDGQVYDDPQTPIKIDKDGYFNGDYFRPYLPAINRNLKDSKGRSWMGNPGESAGELRVKCWQPARTLRVRVADSCPCTQVLKDGAPGVKKGGEVRKQKWCCGGQHHFDLSYWAFEQLAHPLYGAMMLQFRPVDCSTGAELNFNPGFVSRTVYRDGPQPGWGINTYLAQSSSLVSQASGPGGSRSLCVSVAPKGSLSFRCRDCYKPGYQPFKYASALTFWIRSNSQYTDPFSSSTPKGTLPGLKVYLYKEETREFCGKEPVLGTGDVRQDSRQGDWYKVTVQMYRFKCGNGLVAQDQLDVIAFENIAERNALFCLADIKIY